MMFTRRNEERSGHSLTGGSVTYRKRRFDGGTTELYSSPSFLRAHDEEVERDSETATSDGTRFSNQG
jgi:hypothetical protein